jgi:thiamine pyrophosphokinase
MRFVDRLSLATAHAAGCSIIEHPPYKDATDTELALAHAVALGHRHVTLLWGGGDRIDHVLGVIAALAHPSLAHLDGLRAWVAEDRIDIVHSGSELIIDHEPRTVLSLIPIGSRQAVVTTRGLQWELNGSQLSADSARGLSNVVVDTPCSIRSDDGVTAVVTPGLLTIHTRRTCAVSTPGEK